MVSVQVSRCLIVVVTTVFPRAATGVGVPLSAVLPQSACVSERLSAARAHKLLDVRMCIRVLFQVGGALKAFVAEWAAILIDAAVSLVVLLQAVTARKRLGAERAAPPTAADDLQQQQTRRRRSRHPPFSACFPHSARVFYTHVNTEASAFF